MDFASFKRSLSAETPAAELRGALQALWWDAKGDWDKAHKCAQADKSKSGDWVHAYLHRKEGDASNAGYWYGRVGKELSKLSLEEEWREISEALLREGL
ncbi:MAG TPA: hypothetical protein VEJ16_16090 [Alphaproteobacteria bacterium]|nr:hypothetical protein [Alphaproteobacteria bacterium]